MVADFVAVAAVMIVGFVAAGPAVFASAFEAVSAAAAAAVASVAG